MKMSEEKHIASDIMERKISDIEDENFVDSDELCPNCGHDWGDGTELWWDDGSEEYDDREKEDDDWWCEATKIKIVKRRIERRAVRMKEMIGSLLSGNWCIATRAILSGKSGRTEEDYSHRNNGARLITGIIQAACVLVRVG